MRKILLFCLLIAVFILSTGCNWFKKRTSYYSTSPKIKYHYLKPGETLWQISKKYNVNLDYLISINHIEHPDRLRVGTRIIIPLNSQYKPLPSSSKKVVSRKVTTPKKNENKSVTSTLRVTDPTYKKYTGKFAAPVEEGKLVLKFHEDNTLLKEGISLEFTKASPVKAIYDGIVEYSGSEIEGYGKTVIISHPDDYFSLYAFLDEVRVDIGDKVKKNEIIGTTGKRNEKDKYFYFHFQLRKGVNAVDPLKYISFK